MGYAPYPYDGRYYSERFPIINQLTARNRALPSERQESFDQAKNLVQRLQPMVAAPEPSTVAASEADRDVIVDDYDCKLFHKAIVHLASRRHQTGASGILHILQERPQVLKTTTTIATRAGATTTTTRKSHVNDDSATDNNDEDPSSNSSGGKVDGNNRKRRRS